MDTADELQAKMLRILDDHERWAAKDMTVWMGWVYPDLHAILIGVETADLGAVRTALEEAYGRTIEVEFMTRSSPPVPDRCLSALLVPGHREPPDDAMWWASSVASGS